MLFLYVKSLHKKRLEMSPNDLIYNTTTFSYWKLVFNPSIVKDKQKYIFESIYWKYKWKYVFDGPDIYFFPPSKYSLPIFVAATKSYSGGNGNPFQPCQALQPWQTLNLLSQRLTKVIRTSLQVTSRIAFMKFLRGLIFTKKPLQLYGFYMSNIFQRHVKFARPSRHRT